MRNTFSWPPSHFRDDDVDAIDALARLHESHPAVRANNANQSGLEPPVLSGIARAGMTVILRSDHSWRYADPSDVTNRRSDELVALVEPRNDDSREEREQ